MAYEYLADLGLTEEEQSKLKKLGTATAAGLLARIRHNDQSQRAFAQFFGEARAKTLEEALNDYVVQHGGAEAPLPSFEPSFGALVEEDANKDKRDPQKEAEYKVLVVEIERLRRDGQSDSARSRMKDLERRLKSLV